MSWRSLSREVSNYEFNFLIHFSPRFKWSFLHLLSCGSLCFLSSCSISSHLFNSCMLSVGSIAPHIPSFLKWVICIFSISLFSNFLVLWIFSEKQLLFHRFALWFPIVKFIDFCFSFLFPSFYMLWVYFAPLFLGSAVGTWMMTGNLSSCPLTACGPVHFPHITALVNSLILKYYISFHSVLFLNFLWDFLFDMNYLQMCCLLSKVLSFGAFFLLLISNLLHLWSEDTLCTLYGMYDFSPVEYFSFFFWFPRICATLVNVQHLKTHTNIHTHVHAHTLLLLWGVFYVCPLGSVA